MTRALRAAVDVTGPQLALDPLDEAERPDGGEGGGGVMRKWAVRVLMFGVGFRLTMAYPKDDSVEQLALSLVVGLIGAVWIAVACYLAGHLDGEARPASTGGDAGEDA